jgi:hypothetical protein
MTPDLTHFRAIVAKLKEPFPPEVHVERELPGGKSTWFFIPWQHIRERLDAVCPDWQVEYGTPTYLDKYCVVSCKLTIAGVTREALGNAEIELLSKSGRDMSRGTPIERAIADSFKNACEAFGVAAYLDEQSQDKRDFLMRYLHSQGDARALQYARENNWIPGNLPTAEAKRARAAAEADNRRSKANLISEAQQKRFWAIARTDGKYTNDGVGKLLESYQLAHTKDIPTTLYQELCTKAADAQLADQYNRAALLVTQA